MKAVIAMSRKDSVEILFVAGSSRDRKGKRILIREGAVENYIWSKDELQDDGLMKLLGITDMQRDWMKRFLCSKGGN